MSPSASDWNVDPVDAEAVRPLRLAYLRPGQAPEAVAYKSDEDPSAAHFAVRNADGDLIAIGSLHAENRVAGQPPHRHPGIRIRGMATHEDRRSQGLGSAVCQRMIEEARERGALEVWANARTNVRPFYARLGFTVVSAPFTIPTIGEHVVMALPLKAQAAPKAT